MVAPNELDPFASLWHTFGHYLRERRNDLGWSQDDLGTKVHATGTTVGYWEAAKRTPDPKVVPMLDEVLQARGMLVILDHHAREALAKVTPKWFEGFKAAEATATREREYSPQSIPGLLQCEAYARCQFQQMRVPDEVVETWTRDRMKRQEVLTRTVMPLDYWAIIDEGAFGRLMAHPDFASSQLAHIAGLCELPNVTVEILPTSAGLHACMDGAVLLLDLADRGTCAWLEPMGGGHLIAERARVDRLERRYDLLRTETLSVSASMKVIRELLESTS
ncbi:helix-turn-helix domain-containing protein [Yinghuangia seranimata]|uniref:helix-turn-helix domain-containing protein n=1 Tax=Yinghuangia seranimata TaxID=408067 RepID=UPI00248ADFFF|nr:helix-turn-helix transcriptional regulator [Yinghuangia seranimata]MDI2132532.1 helix-turn-helix transcriptional regulator [Yinghuangia seranimata]